MPQASTRDAFLLVSFGGPEGEDDIEPFLANVLRGRRVPPERVQEVAQHYRLFGGRSPINAQNRSLLAALEAELKRGGLRGLPLYWGNRNWHPFLRDTLVGMAEDGVTRAFALVTSAFASYSSCRQYLEDIEAASALVGEKAPRVEKLRLFYNHPGFVEANAAALGSALRELEEASSVPAAIVFTAHSLPSAMAASSRYEAQLLEACRLVAKALGRADWTLAYQSRSGMPQQPWLGPDISDHLAVLRGEGARGVALCPIGFVSDHMEVVYDLDVVAQARARELGLAFSRAKTAGTHPAFVSMIQELLLEKLEGLPPRYLGEMRDERSCEEGCCPPPRREGA